MRSREDREKHESVYEDTSVYGQRRRKKQQTV